MSFVERDEKKAVEKKRRVPRWVKVLLFVAAVILLLLLLLHSCGSGAGDRKPGTDGVTFGVIDAGEKTREDLLRDLNAVVDENQFQVFVDTLVDVDADGHFEPMIQNVSSNPGPCWVEIIDDDGSVIYESDVVEPGYKIERDVLDKTIVRGRHDCQAVFHVLKAGDESREVSSVVVNMILVQR